MMKMAVQLLFIESRITLPGSLFTKAISKPRYYVKRLSCPWFWTNDLRYIGEGVKIDHIVIGRERKQNNFGKPLSKHETNFSPIYFSFWVSKSTFQCYLGKIVIGPGFWTEFFNVDIALINLVAPPSSNNLLTCILLYICNRVQKKKRKEDKMYLKVYWNCVNHCALHVSTLPSYIAQNRKNRPRGRTLENF